MQQLERDLEDAAARWNVPGFGCSIVVDGEVALSRGFGVLRAGENAPVNDRSLFAIGSVSKSFTATAIAQLVDEGKLAWDDRVIDRLKDFRLFDPQVTREITVRDLLTHRSGLERGDFVWYKSGYDVDDVLRRVRFLAPSWALRTNFGYQNIMYAAAGEIIRSTSGLSWNAFVAQRLLAPLDMSDSRTRFGEVGDRSNLATPHVEIDSTITAVEHHDDISMGPAGSIYSSASEMAHWLRFQLEDGTFNGARILTSGSLRELQTPQMLIANVAPWSEVFPRATFISYGMGWFVWTYRGKTIVSHGGNIDGMTAVACVVPEERFGITVLANMDGTSLPQAIACHALDRLFGETGDDWLSYFARSEKTAKERLAYADRERDRTHVEGTKPSRPLEEYAGTFEDPFYGRATVAHDGADLTISSIGFEGTLEHWQYDTFALRANDPILAKYKPFVRFTLDDYGQPVEMTIVLLGVLRLRFAKVAQPAKPPELSAEQLQAYAGRFSSELLSVYASIEPLNGCLKAIVPGSLIGLPSAVAVTSLVPVSTDRFVAQGTQTEFQFSSHNGTRTLRLEMPHQMPLEMTCAS